MTERKLQNSFTAATAHDGDGVDLRRAFPGAQLMEFDPFLLLDELGPTQFEPGDKRGFPPHPHRGFETVTYLLSGQMQHRDSWGNHGLLNSGDVQWMTAGSGLVHSEMPGDDLARQGGLLHGFQLWVNLPRKDKMLAPRYQDTRSELIPVGESPDGRVRVKVIAGESLGTKGAIDTRIQILYLHVTLAPGAVFEQPVPRHANAFVYIVSGEAQAGGEVLKPQQIGLFDRGGEGIAIHNAGSTELGFLLLAAEPLGEPVARYGPFVMNTKEEIVQAVDDFRSGKMGSLL